MKIPAQTAVNPADYTRSLRRMVVPVGTTIDDVMLPGNWSNIFSKVDVRDEIIVDTEDDAWRLHLRVMEKGVGWVKTYPLHVAEFQKVKVVGAVLPDLDIPEGYRINHAPRTLWRVLMDDGLEVSRNHKTKREATEAAIAHAAKASGE